MAPCNDLVGTNKNLLALIAFARFPGRRRCAPGSGKLRHKEARQVRGFEFYEESAEAPWQSRKGRDRRSEIIPRSNARNRQCRSSGNALASFDRVTGPCGLKTDYSHPIRARWRQVRIGLTPPRRGIGSRKSYVEQQVKAPVPVSMGMPGQRATIAFAQALLASNERCDAACCRTASPISSRAGPSPAALAAIGNRSSRV